METELIRIAGIGIVGALLAVVVSEKKPEMGMLIGLAFGVLALVLVAGKAGAVIQLINESVRKSGIDADLIVPILKVTGMAYITQFAVDACRDAGQNGIASKIEIAGKIMMLAVAVPLATALIKMVTTIL
ncbi:MAG TPA: SpoIIIAC/SpoIIIAD family protein [Thermoclostridium caenicola]|uniref:Stage III sporulation protein AD n=1 Tax=Thermoclostridium caenicola TaxID=659425 RepID=A0A1M6C9H6_9FIRM|nr:SpoIIIAC/SpoIIIAD family protein [Thermoclostridium caenicola]SHI57655.1 stage III sporulation protein AD [Thermoclostridium caenicola]HOK42472.1 SpoIIIAC/SpoIIIAD family protein [Thermoclostridium caenicola]HOL84387.1 SpoIIIAC/SpoIIIAD family protein [Thermoclostridium caenicola]HOP71697.1 SpoIIIAC/SpoIIIAD family protein [Thermoclostridium caenicola]HPO77563.1 SpoIIIAC/SpoIIIAD family protein [Thermoclostridium caenicola]